MRKKLMITLWAVFLLGVAGAVSLFWLIDRGDIGYMPDTEDLENPVDRYASQIISADGVLLGTWSYRESNRVMATYDELPQAIVDALIATEDVRFREHSGVDFRSLVRAIVKTGLMHKKSSGGGSTITQQLAKQLYSARTRSKLERMMQKPIEWVIAVRLERQYTKEEIIALYLNYFDFLHGAVGIKLAARTYFGKEPSELTIGECATLVGMLKNPSYFNPRRNIERAEGRRNTVVGQMQKASYLTEAEADSIMAVPLSLERYAEQSHQQGLGTYFREMLRTMMTAKKPERSNYASWQAQKFYEDSLDWELNPLYGWCNKNINPHTGKPYDIYQAGLKIYTALDSRMQQAAEKAVSQHVAGELQPAFNRNKTTITSAIVERAKKQSARWATMKRAGYSEAEIEEAFATPTEMTIPLTTGGTADTLMTPTDSIRHMKGFLRTGFVCIDNRTGAVKAYVGGTNYRYFQYDMASTGRRQVGSTVKPFLYAMAMENGWCPCDVVPNEPRTYLSGGKAWTPRNSSSARRGEMVTLRWGLAQSNNWVSAYLLNELSPTLLVKYLRKFGIRNRQIDAVLPLCLGTCDVSVMEMTTAYTAFPRGGTRCEPMMVVRIVDAEGNEVANASTLQKRKNASDDLDTREVLTQDAAFKMVDLMQGVINSGTGARMRSRYGIQAQMAGKTGTTNDNSDGWFVGYTPSLTFGAWVGGEERDIHFQSMNYGQGAAAALPIAALFLKEIYAQQSALGYSPAERFDFPKGYDPCADSVFDDGDEPEEYDEPEESPSGLSTLINKLFGL